MDTNQRLMAFWKYDRYPYLCSGEVKRFTKSGNVEIVTAPGYTFGPVVKVLPYEEGLEIKKKLSLLEAQYDAKLDEIHEVFNKKAKELFNV